MSPREEEEFELVLGNKQLLSLFFLVVVLFGVFFSFGYTVGYSRGESSQTRDVAGAQPAGEPAKKVELPEALLQDAPKPAAPAAATPATPEPSSPAPSATAKNEPRPSVAKSAPASEAPKPRPVQEPPKPAATPPATRTAPSTKPATPAPTPASAPAKASGAAPPAQAIANATHIQVAAVQVQKDAEVLVQQLRAKGHPAALTDQGDGWYRVVVGPFNTPGDAEAYQKRLAADGMTKTMIRRR
jgi:cell division protein FtsN